MSEEELYSSCSTHDDAAALFRCCECGSYLCPECAEQGSHLVICRLCGERAVALEEWERPTAAGAVFDPPPRGGPGPLASRADSAQRRAAEPGLADLSLDDPGLWLVNHLVIPAATIAMVSSLLFFLLDVRSVYLAGTGKLKWIGFCFVAATVLIARYRRMSSNAEAQGCYTFALAAATLLAMTVAPWESSPDGLGAPLVNVVIIVAVWRFASRLTASLSLEDDAAGVAALTARPDRNAASRGAAPNVVTARLAALVLCVFALGEPFLLAGPPAAGERALAAMVVFLFSTGVVLACASGISLYRRVVDLGGTVPGNSIAKRGMAGALAMVAILALALTLPGIEHRGSGEIVPAAAEGGIAGGEEPGEATRGSDRQTTDGRRETPAGQARPSQTPQRATSQPSDSGTRGATGLAAPAQLLAALAALGQWLRIPFFIAAIALGLYGLWRLRASLGGWLRDRRQGIRLWLAHLAERLRRWLRRDPGRQPKQDPLADLSGLHGGEPRAAVLAAYSRLLGAFELLGHRRPERQTPYEFLAALPPRLKPLAEPAKRLTDAYVAAAYGAKGVAEADRQASIAALERLAALRDARRPV